MTQLEGTAQNVRTEQEQANVVLRFVVSTANERVPVEMRGVQILGVLNDGDQILVEGRRDRDGVIRPKTVRNLSTNSTVQMRGPNPISTLASFVFSVAFSVFTGALSTVLIGLIGRGEESAEIIAVVPEAGGEAVPYVLEESVAGGSEVMQIVAIVIGLVVALIVFYLVYIRPRSKRRA
jgi:hypothetical protein